MNDFEAGQLAMRARAQRAAGEAAHRHEGHDGYNRVTDAAVIRQTQACVDAIGALDVEVEPAAPVQPQLGTQAMALEAAARACEAAAEDVRAANTFRDRVDQVGVFGSSVADDCAKRIRALGAAPTPALAQEGWQDISTAPRDGQPILAWDPYYLMRCARPDPSSGSWLTDLPYGVERGEREMRIEPTHWMPLPAPPTGAAP